VTPYIKVQPDWKTADWPKVQCVAKIYWIWAIVDARCCNLIEPERQPRKTSDCGSIQHQRSHAVIILRFHLSSHSAMRLW